MQTRERVALRWPRPPILVVGAHRSGTTATARALQLLGLQIGEQLDSHKEPRELQRLHEAYLHRLGAAWHDPNAFLEWVQTEAGKADCSRYLRENVDREFAAIFGYRKNPYGLYLLARLKLGRLWGWKEPRTTLFASVWLKLFPAARIVHVVRHPLDVALSIQKRELAFRAKGDPPTGKLDDFNYCLRLAITYVERGEALAAKAQHYHRIRFEDMQTNPKTALETLANFCGLRVKSAQMNAAIAGIRPQSFARLQSLPQEIGRELLSNYPIAAELGYG